MTKIEPLKGKAVMAQALCTVQPIKYKEHRVKYMVKIRKCVTL